MASRTTVNCLVGHKRNGDPVLEEVLVDLQDDGAVRVVASPTLALGFAAGDLLRVDDEGRTEVIERGGNLAVQVYVPHEHLDRWSSQLRDLGGRVDGRAPGVSVVTVPVSAGFQAVEKLVTEIVQSVPDGEWYFGNVYADDGETPLNWWK